MPFARYLSTWCSRKALGKRQLPEANVSFLLLRRVPCQGPSGSEHFSGGGAGTRLSHLSLLTSGMATGQGEPHLESAWPSSSFSCKGTKGEVSGEARGPWEGWRVDPEEETQATALTVWLEGGVSGCICGCVPRVGVVSWGAWIQLWPCHSQPHDLGQAAYLYVLAFCEMGLSSWSVRLCSELMWGSMWHLGSTLRVSCFC